MNAAQLEKLWNAGQARVGGNAIELVALAQMGSRQALEKLEKLIAAKPELLKIANGETR